MAVSLKSFSLSVFATSTVVTVFSAFEMVGRSVAQKGATSSEANWMLWRRSWTVTATHVARASLGVREVCGGYSVRVVVVLSEVELSEVVVLSEAPLNATAATS